MMVWFLAGVMVTVLVRRAAVLVWSRWCSQAQPLYQTPKTDAKKVSYW